MCMLTRKHPCSLCMHIVHSTQYIFASPYTYTDAYIYGSYLHLHIQKRIDRDIQTYILYIEARVHTHIHAHTHTRY